MKYFLIVAALFILTYPLTVHGQTKEINDEPMIRDEGIPSKHEMLKELPANFRDRMNLDLSIEENPKIKNDIKKRIAEEYNRYVLSLSDISLTGCDERGQSIMVFKSKRLDEIYNIANAFYCDESRNTVEYFIFKDNEKANLGGNEIFNTWNAYINEHEVNRNIRGHQYGRFWVIPGDEEFVDKNPLINLIYDRFFIKIWIAGQGPDKLDLLDKYALKAIEKIRVAQGEILLN